jgi:hypothetical protein
MTSFEGEHWISYQMPDPAALTRSQLTASAARELGVLAAPGVDHTWVTAWVERNKVWVDKFMFRYGAIKGRCNAKRRKHKGKLCQKYPLSGMKRCRLHNGAKWMQSVKIRPS